MSNFPEADWKYMQGLRSTLIERLCERINQKTADILNDPAKTAYERYLAIYEKTQRDDRDVARAFDDWRRSTLPSVIFEIYRQGLFTESDLEGFTPETQERIESFKPVRKTKS